MLDEEMDDIIREAAEKHHPAYHDNAWEKMQQKLDAELPQKPARKRYIYHLLLLLLIGGSVYTGVRYLSNNATATSPVTADKKDNAPGKRTQKDNMATANKPAITPSTVNENVTGSDVTVTASDAQPGNQPAATLNPKSNNSKQTGEVAIATPTDNNPSKLPFIKNNRSFGKTLPAKRKRNTASSNPGQDNNKDYAVINKTRNQNNISTGGNDREDALVTGKGKTKLTTKSKTRMQVSSPAAAADAPVTPADAEQLVPAIDENVTAATDAKKQEVQKNKDSIEKNLEKELIAEKKKDKDSTQTVSNPKEKKQKGFANNFGITASAGIDASFIKLNEVGKATFIYGAGLSYNISKRFTVMGGFYVSKKIYSADAYQYKPAGGTYPYFTGADAVCKVYEIPVSVNYNFFQGKNHNWFAGVGLSSFLMKKEDYDYKYKNPAGQVYSYKHSISNENKHYFSVLNLTAGYQYNLGNRISLMAAPFVKIPLGGVGLGNIKLKSAGVVATVVVRPFAKK